MTGDGGVMTTSASIGVIYSAPQAPSWISGDVRGKAKERRGKKTKGGKGRGGMGKGKGVEEKMRGNGRGSEGRDGTPLFGTSDANVSQ